jgi:hypothetical protein
LIYDYAENKDKEEGNVSGDIGRAILRGIGRAILRGTHHKEEGT